VVDSLHTTYTEVFLISAFICLVSLIPAFFLWGRQAPQVEPEEHELLLYEDEGLLSPEVLRQRKRKSRVTVGIVLLAVLLIVGGLTAEWFRENAEYGGGLLFTTHTTNTTSNGNVVSGPRMFQIALDKAALTSIFAGQLGTQGALTDLSAAPGPNDGLTLTVNLNINVGGFQRVIPVEIDGQVGLDDQQNLQITILQLKRDGVVADGNTTASVQNALNQMLVSTVMSTLHSQFQGTKLISVHTSTTIVCAQETEMFVLQVESPAVAGIAAQPTPVPFCFKGPIDLRKLLPQ